MTDSLKALFTSWCDDTRSITLEFINELSDADLDKKLPRKELNTIRLQSEEMAFIQKDFVEGLRTKVLEFNAPELGKLSKQEIAKMMAELDGEMEKLLAAFDGTESIDVYGTPYNIHRYIATMIIHENMHIGQIIAFCYATGIEVPAAVTENLALEG